MFSPDCRCGNGCSPSPKRLRYFLQRDTALQGAVLRMLLRGVERCLREHSSGCDPTARIGAIAFVPAAIVLYTRLLSPGDYGHFALVVAGVTLVNSVLFYWLLVGLKRFLPRYQGMEHTLLATIAAAFFVLAAALAAAVGLTCILVPEAQWRATLPIALMVVLSHGWFELNLQLAAARLEPGRYGALGAIRAILALGIGATSVLLGATWQGPLWALVAGAAVAVLLVGRQGWRGASARGADRRLLGELGTYGLPISLTYLLVFASGSLAACRT